MPRVYLTNASQVHQGSLRPVHAARTEMPTGAMMGAWTSAGSGSSSKYNSERFAKVVERLLDGIALARDFHLQATRDVPVTFVGNRGGELHVGHLACSFDCRTKSACGSSPERVSERQGAAQRLEALQVVRACKDADVRERGAHGAGYESVG